MAQLDWPNALTLTLYHTFKRSLDYYSVWFFKVLYSFVIASSLTFYTRCVITRWTSVLRICANRVPSKQSMIWDCSKYFAYLTQIRGTPILSWSYGFGLCHSIFTVWSQSLDSSPFILKLVIVNFKRGTLLCLQDFETLSALPSVVKDSIFNEANFIFSYL